MTVDLVADTSSEGSAPDEELGRLLRSLALSERFHFYVAVCGTPRVADALFDELAAKLPAEREAEVRFVRLDPYAKHEDFGEPLSVDEAVAAVLEPLVYPPDESRRHGVVHVLDTSRAVTDDEKAFRWVFGRMNERRNHITRALGGELVLLATPAIEQLFVEAAPDFWSIRSDTYVFREGAFAARSQVPPEVPLSAVRGVGHEPAGRGPSVLTARPSASPLLESATEGLSARPLEPTAAAGALAKEPSRLPVDDAVAQFKPFLQFVRETWSVASPGDLSAPAHAANVLDGVDTALTAGWRPRPGKQTRLPWRARPWSSYSPEELAAAAQVAGRTELARRIYRAVLDEARGEGGADFDPSVARVVLLLAALEIEQGRAEAAHAVVSEAEEMGAPRRMDYLRVLWWLQGLGLFYRCLPDAERALEKFGASLEALEHLSHVTSFEESLLPEGLVLAAESAVALGPPARDLARQWSERALEVLQGPHGAAARGERKRPIALELRALLALGRARQALHDSGGARAAFAEAATLARALERSSAAVSAAALAHAAEALDEYAKALEGAGSSRRDQFFRGQADSMVARALRQLPDRGIDGFDPRDLQVEWGRVVRGQPKPLPHEGAVIMAGDFVYIRLKNCGKREIYVSVFDLGVSGKVTLLTAGWSSGVDLQPGEEELLGQTHDGAMVGTQFYWPPTVPPDEPRPEELLFVVTDEPIGFRGLGAQSPRGGQDPLEWLTSGTFQHGLRSLSNARTSARTGLHVRRIRFMLAP